MIHSREKSPKEIFKFCKLYKKFKVKKPLVAVPSSYSVVKEEELIKNGISMVIYANHLLRSIYPNMVATAKSILKFKRAKESEKTNVHQRNFKFDSWNKIITKPHLYSKHCYFYLQNILYKYQDYYFLHKYNREFVYLNLRDFFRFVWT